MPENPDRLDEHVKKETNGLTVASSDHQVLSLLLSQVLTWRRFFSVEACSFMLPLIMPHPPQQPEGGSADLLGLGVPSAGTNGINGGQILGMFTIFTRP